MSGIFQRILFCSAFLLWIKRQHQHRFLLPNSHKVLFSNVCSVPCSRWKNHLQFGHASIHRHQELDIVEGHGRGHGVPVVFVVYPQVRGGGLTLPAHYQVQRRGLVALRRYLRTQNRGVITFSRGDIPNACGGQSERGLRPDTSACPRCSTSPGVFVLPPSSSGIWGLACSPRSSWNQPWVVWWCHWWENVEGKKTTQKKLNTKLFCSISLKCDSLKTTFSVFVTRLRLLL